MAALIARTATWAIRTLRPGPRRRHRRAGALLRQHQDQQLLCERIRRGEAYYGESFVQDTAYVAGYEPIRDASANVIGVYATGYVKR
jgi:Cache 3/Cache 2 fusion domain